MEGNYKTKKELKGCIGEALRFRETSIFGSEYKSDGVITLEGPAYKPHTWYARVTMKDHKIVKVS